MRPATARIGGTICLATALFIAGVGGRQVVDASAAPPETPPAVSIARSLGTLYDGGYPAYAAVVARDGITAYAAPDLNAPVMASFGRTNTEGAPTTFLVKGEQQENAEPAWYQVALPVRPNETRAWVRSSDVSIEGMSYRIVVHLRSFKLQLFKNRALEREFVIGTGTADTPTPIGEHYVVELLRPPNLNSVYGHHVLGLSGFSDVLVDWPGGGHVAIHGTNDPRRTLGHRVSHGCIRLANADMDALAATIPLGTPVRVIDD